MITFGDSLTGKDLDPRIKFERAAESLIKWDERGRRISITATSMAAQKNRTEMKVFGTAEPGKLCQYAHEILIPSNFKPCATYEIMGQIHAGQLADGSWPLPLLAMRHYPDDRVDFVYGLNDGPLRKHSKKMPFKRGAFHEIEWHVFWSTGADGYADLWLDGQKVQRFEGPNLHATALELPYIKLGMYRPNGGRSSTFIIVRDWIAQPVKQ